MNGAFQPIELCKTLQFAHDQIRCQIRRTQVIQRRTQPQVIACDNDAGTHQLHHLS